MVQPHPARRAGWMVAGVATFVLGGLMWFYGRFYPLHHDLAGGVLTGQLAVTLGDAFGRYGIYFPPAERAWYSLAVWLSSSTGLRLDLAIAGMTGLAVLFGTWLAWLIRRRTTGASPLFFAASTAVLIVLPILFKNVFGLREHIVAAGLWPYIVLRVSDPEGTRIGYRLRLLVGVWMGATLLLKYVYSAVVLLVELAEALVSRRPGVLLRIENVAAGGIVFAYLFVWLGLDPTQRQMIGVMVSAIDANLATPGENLSNVAANLVGAGLLLLLSRIFRVPGRIVAIALAVMAGAIVAAWSQERWYTHHVFPVTLACITWWWMAADRLRAWGHAAIALFVTFTIGNQFFAAQGYRAQLAELDTAITARNLTVEGKRVAILNMHPSPYNQFLVTHGAQRWTPMVNIAYVAADLKPFDAPGNAGKALPPVSLTDPGRRMLHDRMLGLWEDLPPDVLIMDRTSSWPLRHVTVDWQRAFSRDGRFAAFMAHYRPVLVHDGRDLKFTYYVRAP